MKKPIPILVIAIMILTPTACSAIAVTSSEEDSAIETNSHPDGWSEQTHGNNVEPNYDVVFPDDKVNALVEKNRTACDVVFCMPAEPKGRTVVGSLPGAKAVAWKYPSGETVFAAVVGKHPDSANFIEFAGNTDSIHERGGRALKIFSFFILLFRFSLGSYRQYSSFENEFHIF